MQVSGLLTQPAVIHSLDSNFDVASDSGCLPSKRSHAGGKSHFGRAQSIHIEQIFEKYPVLSLENHFGAVS